MSLATSRRDRATTRRSERQTAPSRRPRTSMRRVRGRTIHYIILIAVLFLMIGPLIGPLLAAFKGVGEPLFGPDATLLPQQWNLSAFEELFARTDILRAIGNSLFVCALSVVSHLLLATVGGYMLSRKGWRGRGLAFLIVTSALIFPFEAIMVSLFAQVRDLGMYDSLLGVWLPGMLGPFHVLLMRAAFLAVPDEIEDAALLDGAGEWRRFWTIFLPQTKGALVIVGLTSFIYAWEDYLWPLLVIRGNENFTLMLEIATLQSSFGFDYRVVLAGALTALVPVAVIFFLTQRYFFKGIEEGGMKF